jgi:hypothetical protein
MAEDLQGIKGTVIFVRQGCYSGGVIDDVSKVVDNGIFISSTDEYTVSYGNPRTNMSYFTEGLIFSLGNNGSVSTAFEYAIENDKADETPQKIVSGNLTDVFLPIKETQSHGDLLTRAKNFLRGLIGSSENPGEKIKTQLIEGGIV